MKTPHRSITFPSITPFVMAWALSWLIFSVGFNGQMLPAHAEVTSPSPLAKFTHPGLSYSHRQGNASLAPANDDSEPPTDIAFFFASYSAVCRRSVSRACFTQGRSTFLSLPYTSKGTSPIPVVHAYGVPNSIFGITH